MEHFSHFFTCNLQMSSSLFQRHGSLNPMQKQSELVHTLTLALCVAALSVLHQAAAVRTHSDLQVAEYTHLDKTLKMTEQQWSQEMKDNQV